jgi:hypothetical protein
MLLVPNGRLDDGSMVGIWDQADDEVMLCDFGVEGLVVGDIDRDGVGVLDAFGELLRCCEGPARFGALDGHREWDRVGRVPTVTEMPASLRMSSVGLVTNPAPSISTLLGPVSRNPDGQTAVNLRHFAVE